MADTLKEIYRGSIALSDVAATGALTLLTTDAVTQYVIKDVQVTAPIVGATTPVLTVNDVPVVSLLSSSSGSEIVDTSSSIKYRAFTAAPTLVNKSFEGFTSSTTYFSDVAGLLNGVAVTPYSLASSTTTNLNAQVSIPTEFLKATNGDVFFVFWDGNSQSILYKRTGGPNGSESTIVNNSYGWCVSNGVDAYYYCSNGSSTVFKYNINTGATTAVSCPELLSSSSYPSAYYMASGQILVSTTGNSDPARLLIVNPNNGVRVIVNLSTLSVSGNAYKFSGVLDSVTGKYTLYRRFGGTLNKVMLNSAIGTSSGTYAGTVTETSLSITGFPQAAYITQTPTTYSYALHNVPGKTQLVTLDTVTGTATTADFLSFTTASHSFNFATTPALASNFTQTATLRITGVKTV